MREISDDRFEILGRLVQLLDANFCLGDSGCRLVRRLIQGVHRLHDLLDRPGLLLGAQGDLLGVQYDVVDGA